MELKKLPFDPSKTHCSIPYYRRWCTFILPRVFGKKVEEVPNRVVVVVDGPSDTGLKEEKKGIYKLSEEV